MATRDAEDPLAEQVRQRMPDLARLPVVDQTLGESLDHARTGTTKRNPSAEATSPPPHFCASGIVVWASTKAALARVRVSARVGALRAILGDPATT